jgi:hypothetical protein
MADHIEVWRGGMTTRVIVREAEPNVRIRAGYPHKGSGSKKGGLTVAVDIASKGGGTTTAHIWIPPSVFGHLAAVMLNGDVKAAETAFLKHMLARRGGQAEGA